MPRSKSGFSRIDSNERCTAILRDVLKLAVSAERAVPREDSEPAGEGDRSEEPRGRRGGDEWRRGGDGGRRGGDSARWGEYPSRRLELRM